MVGIFARATHGWPTMSLSLTMLVLAALCQVYGAPSPSRILLGRAIQPRASGDGSQSSGLSVQVWAPLVAITVVIIAMISFSCVKRRRIGVVAAIARAATSTRELTADQLTGSRGATTTGSTATGRQRRQRRTPSQISTRSLPVYMEDPGDSEMVLVRGGREMDDPMPTVSEDQPEHNSSNSLGSLGDFNASNTSQTPLLRTDSHLSPPAGENDGRASFDTVRMGSEDSQHGLLDRSRGHSRQPSAEELQARGDAPPYFEVVGEADIAQGSMEMDDLMTPTQESNAPHTLQAPPAATEGAPPPTAIADPPSAGESSQRRSGFRSFAARLSQLMPSTSSSPVTAAPPVPPVPTSPGDPASGTRHRTSTSGSGSTLTSPSRSSHFLPRSRSIRSLRSNASQVNLTSPSTSSLGPISAPLSHTLVRTEFAYPRGGPTSEQMKFISSRETLGKFGVPYGLAAQAQALASREALVLASDEAPPPFESPMVESGPSAAHPAGEEESQLHGLGDSAPESSETTSISSGNDVASSLSPESGQPDKSDKGSFKSSDQASIVTFETAQEAPPTDTDTTESEHDGDDVTQSRSSTPTPTTNEPLTIDVNVAATKSVPTPPPTPPRSTPPAVPALEVPSITVAPVSPA